MRFRTAILAGIACFSIILPATAHEGPHNGEPPAKHGPSAAAHAPIGVMGDHMHRKGEWMLSYRYMHMDMHGSRKGTNDVDPVITATTEPNSFFGTPGQPATLRVVPTSMSMDMHMLGLMYAPVDSVTFMVMGNYLEKDMDHITFMGATGTAVRGTFSTASKGWGDTRVKALVKLYDDAINHLQLDAGISLPTGSLTKTGTVLAPTGATPRLRLPYAMQLGTGTYDLLPGVTYTGHSGPWGWGAQYAAEIRLEDKNDEGYRWGNRHGVSAWGSYEWAPWISTSLRASGHEQGDIHGIDPQIVAPVQTADPDNYGGRTIDLGAGVNLLGTRGALKGHRLAIEASMPIYRDLNGPQLETDWQVTAGWQYAF